MSDQDTPHHLMRVRVRTSVFRRLQEIAYAETYRTGDHTSVSDLVRSALFDYINVYEATSKLYEMEAERVDSRSSKAANN
jgi:hypothetical protein